MKLDVRTPSPRPGRHRGSLLRTTVVATLGLVLAVPITAAPGSAAPARTGILDAITDPLTQVLDPVTGLLLTAPEPVIAKGAAGSITVLGQVVCTSDGSVEKVCDPLPLGGLGSLSGLTSLVLTAVPAAPADIPQWDPATCPAAVGPLCSLPLDLLTGAPKLPRLTFRTPDAEDAAAPQTSLSSATPGRYATRHTFTFTSSTGAAQFSCRLQAAHRGADSTDTGWQRCDSGARTYTGLTPGDYVFAVRAAAGDPAVADPTPATEAFTLATPPVPGTAVVSGPRRGAWLVGNRVTYRFRSTVAGSTFACRFDGRLQGSACNAGRWSRRTPAAGTHRLTVAARAHGVADPSPAARVFRVPLDDRQLRTVGRWVHARQRGAFRGTVRVTRARGAGLVTRGRVAVKRVVLVADKGRGHGTVKVYLGKRLLKRVSLHARRALKRRVIPIAALHRVRKGRVRVVVVGSGRPVRIDGLGVARR